VLDLDSLTDFVFFFVGLMCCGFVFLLALLNFLDGWLPVFNFCVLLFCVFGFVWIGIGFS